MFPYGYRGTLVLVLTSAIHSAIRQGMSGISAPFGLFDPAGFLNDQTIPEIKRLRESEIVHGRLAMLAALGFLVGESGATPLFNGDIQGLAINQFQQVPAGFEAAVTLAIGIAEAGRASKGWVEPGNGLFTLRDSYAPGDLGFDPLGLKPTVAADLKDMQTKEINNGRLAMLAIGAPSPPPRERVASPVQQTFTDAHARSRFRCAGGDQRPDHRRADEVGALALLDTVCTSAGRRAGATSCRG